MSTQPPPASRFVPTLTEVVESLPLICSIGDASTSADEKLNEISLQISTLIDYKLATAEALIHSVIKEQFQNLANNLKAEAEAIALQAICKSEIALIDRNK
jgi:hypothetical protein